MRLKLIFLATTCFIISLYIKQSQDLTYSSTASTQSALQQREKLYRFNNLGVARMEEFKHEAAVVEFKKAIELDPNFLLARINLALGYYYTRNKQSAIDEAKAVLKVEPKNPYMHYMLGLIYKTANQPDEAITELEQVAAVDPEDVGTNVNLGMLYSQKQQYDKAIPYLKRAVENEPYNSTANYAMAIALLRKGERNEGQKLMEHFQKLRTSDYATTFGQLYFEQGHYAECIESKGDEVATKTSIAFTVEKLSFGETKSPNIDKFVGKKIPKSDFANEAFQKQLVTSFSATTAFFDMDADGDADLLCISGSNLQLFRNDGSSKFTDVTESSKLKIEGLAMGAIFADFDNDLKTDIFIHGYKLGYLFRNNGDGTFSDVTTSAKLNSQNQWTLTATFVDCDHDGDADLYLGNFVDLGKWPGAEVATFPDDFIGENNRLYRNNGDGTFTDITETAGVAGGGLKTTAVLPADFDDKRDIDLIVINYGQPAQIFSNQRTGTFKDVARQVGFDFAGKSFAVGVGDINKDGYVDIFAPSIDTSSLFLSDGKGKYKRSSDSFSQAIAGQVLDYDNDGLLDLASLSLEKLELYRNTGSSFVSADAKLPKFDTPKRLFSTADFDVDGDLDILTSSLENGLVLFGNQGGNKNGWLRVDLQGRVSNRSGVGAKVELRSGSLKQRREVFASSPAPAPGEMLFGLGFRQEVDSVRIIWPAGIVQPEIGMASNKPCKIQELDRKGTSCPLLYGWNGERFGFITDFLGGCSIGYLTAPGQFNYPDTDEYILVRGEQLKPKNGLYSLRMNNQLEEVIFFDAVRMLAVDHPADTEIFPNERLLPAPPYPEFKIYSVKNPQLPVSAIGNKGQDILPLIAKIDRLYPEDFKLLPFKGYSEEHSITLDLGDTKGYKQILLLLHAWIDYADSTSNLAASQTNTKLTPPYLQVKNRKGEWQTVIEQMGFPAGLPKTMTVDLTDKFLTEDRSLRIVTSMRIYWDQILVDKSDGDSNVLITELEPAKADLGWRGFPQEYRPEGKQPLVYDYQKVDQIAPWKVHLGNYTRYGDVKPLLLSPDDMYVITRNGDEIELEFDASRLPKLTSGWKRDFLIYADGFGKDMDINSAKPETVGPLPFHKMSSYPYKSSKEAYPNGIEHQEYIEKYNTRSVRRQY